MLKHKSDVLVGGVRCACGWSQIRQITRDSGSLGELPEQSPYMRTMGWKGMGAGMEASGFWSSAFVLEAMGNPHQWARELTVI